jgi:hypothetical protein
MHKFQVTNNKREPLDVVNLQQSDNGNLDFYRWEKRGVVRNTQSHKEYLVFVDNLTQQIYIEELDVGQLSRIEEEELFDELFSFATIKGLTDIMMPISK